MVLVQDGSAQVHPDFDLLLCCPKLLNQTDFPNITNFSQTRMMRTKLTAANGKKEKHAAISLCILPE
jgi:hypothetical protein